MSTRLSILGPLERRGSRVQCVKSTDDAKVAAARLSRLVERFAVVDATRRPWMPRGATAPPEAKLGEAARLLSTRHRELSTGWSLAVVGRADTPAWDIAATATIEGREGLALVETEAHSRELKDDRLGAGNELNRGRNRAAILDADRAVNALEGVGAPSCESRYQFARRCAWSRKLGAEVPV